MADTYHIALDKGQVPSTVLLPGDPARSKYIADFFDRSRKLAQNREFTSYAGEYKGVPVGVTSTGIGCPSTAIAVEELAQVGADTFIRVGTAGSLQPQVRINDVVIVTGAVREEGTSLQYVPLSYPAVADLDVALALRTAARRLRIPHHVGLEHVKDAFYIEEPERMPIGEELERRWGVWKRAGVLITSMESSTIFIVAGLRKCRAGAVLAAVGATAEGTPFSDEDTTKGVDRAIRCALEAAVRLHEEREERK